MKNEGGGVSSCHLSAKPKCNYRAGFQPPLVNAVDRACGQVHSVSVQEWDKLLHSRSIAERGKKKMTRV